MDLAQARKMEQDNTRYLLIYSIVRQNQIWAGVTKEDLQFQKVHRQSHCPNWLYLRTA